MRDAGNHMTPAPSRSRRERGARRILLLRRQSQELTGVLQHGNIVEEYVASGTRSRSGQQLLHVVRRELVAISRAPMKTKVTQGGWPGALRCERLIRGRYLGRRRAMGIGARYSQSALALVLYRNNLQSSQSWAI